MKNTILFTGIAVLVVGGYLVRQAQPLAVSQAIGTSPTPKAKILPYTYAPTVDNTKKKDYPVKLIIPSLKVETEVQAVGLDKEGRMDTPEGIQEVAWYKLGYGPGEKGSTVIAGHFDGKKGEPGVFYELNNLNKGDDVIVTTQQGNTYTYTVTQKKTFPYTELPLLTVFGKSDKEYLNLITCSGTYDTSKTTYSERLIVYTERKER